MCKLLLLFFEYAMLNEYYLAKKFGTFSIDPIHCETKENLLLAFELPHNFGFLLAWNFSSFSSSFDIRILHTAATFGAPVLEDSNDLIQNSMADSL